MRFRGLTYTNVTATLALFIALGGSSYAAVSLTGGNIRNGTVTGSDLKDESVKGRDVDNGTVTGSDLKNGSVASSDIDNGSLLSKDVKAGTPLGPQGPTGTTQAVTRRTEEMTLTLGQVDERTASCLPGEIAVGGGGGNAGAPSDVVVALSDEPVKANGAPPASGEQATGWRVVGLNPLLVGPTTGHVNVYVLCTKA
jgi:hypothetical protein